MNYSEAKSAEGMTEPTTFELRASEATTTLFTMVLLCSW